MPDATHHGSAARPERNRNPGIRIWTALLGHRSHFDEERLERERARRHAWVRSLIAEISVHGGSCRSAR